MLFFPGFFLPPCFFQSPGRLDRVTPVRVLAVILSQARGWGVGGGGKSGKLGSFVLRDTESVCVVGGGGEAIRSVCC